MTVLERDSRGRPARFHIEEEVEWDQEQLDLMLALDGIDPELGPHGVPMDEATSPLADVNDRFRGWHYVPHVRTDHAQKALNAAQDERAKTWPEEDAGSLLWSLERVEDGPQITD